MPNHIENNVTLEGKETDIKAFWELVKSNESQFDINKYFPMPSELEGFVSPTRILTQKEYDEQERRIANNELTEAEKSFGLSRGMTQEMADEFTKKYGCSDWYSWKCENWGTKWGAYDVIVGGEYNFTFQTAWSTPFRAMIKLSELCPNVVISVEYADEDFGYNVGKYTLKGGKCVKEYVPVGGSVEALTLAMEVRGDNEYYLYDYLCEIDENDIDDNNFVQTLIKMAHYEGNLIDEYPLGVLKLLEKYAVADEQYERANIIKKMIAEKQKETEEN